MARVSDTHLLKNFDNSLTTYEGPWEPHVRDFDPTLNRHFLMPSNLPTFNYPIFEEDLFLNVEPLPKDEEILEWKKRNTNLFSYLNTKLKFEDCNGNSWIALTLYENHENDKKRERNSSLEFKNGSQEIWFMAHGLFIEQERFDQIKEHLAKINCCVSNQYKYPCIKRKHFCVLSVRYRQRHGYD